MKLLLLIHRLPCPADRGAKLRAAAELHYLAQRHEVWCAGFLERERGGDQEQVRRSLAQWRGMCRELTAIPLRRTLAGARAAHRLAAGATATEGYFASRQLERQVRSWASHVDFDAVLAFSSSMAPLALKVPARRHVLDLVDLDSRKWTESARSARWPMRWVYRTEGQRLARREREWMNAFDASVLVNEREAALLSEQHDEPISGAGRIHVIETGAWLETRAMHGAGRREAHAMGALPSEANIGFVGAMDYPPNIEAARWFTHAILPLVRARRPEVAFWIIGRSPTAAVRALDDGCSVRVTGTVPAIEPYLARLRVSVAPLRLARGVQTKVLMAMAAGIPSVVTSCVAAGIGARPGHEIMVADSPEQFARAVERLLDDHQAAEKLGETGRRFVLSRYDPSPGLAQLERLLQGRHCAGNKITAEARRLCPTG